MTLYNRLYTEEIDTIVLPTTIGVDDILSFALMSIINRTLQIEIVDKKDIEDFKNKDNCLLVNIGGSDFDSHQAFFDLNEQGHKMTAFSKLYKELGEDIFGYQELADVFRMNVIEDIDNVQTKRSEPENEFNLVTILDYYLPEWNEHPDDDILEMSLRMAINFAANALERLINHYVQIDRAHDLICSRFDEKDSSGLLVFDEFVPNISKMVDVLNTDSEGKVYFVVYPSQNDKEHFVYESCLVNDAKKVINNSNVPTTKDGLIEFLKRYITI